MRFQIKPYNPKVYHARVAPAHANTLIGINLQQQLPLLCAFRELSHTRVIHIRNTVRSKLALKAHIILNGLRVPQQLVMHSGVIVRIWKCREQRLVFLYLLISPIKVSYFKLWLLRQRDLASKANGTGFKLALSREIYRTSSTLQSGIVIAKDNTPATEVRWISSIRFLFRVVEKPQHPTLWQRFICIVLAYIIEVYLRNKRLWHAFPIRPGKARWYVWNSANSGFTNRNIVLTSRCTKQPDRIFRYVVNVF